MDKGPCPIFHLGMTGCLKYLEDYKKGDVEKSSEMEESGYEEQEENTSTKCLDWPPPYWKFVFKFDDGTEVAFINKRRLGRIYLMEDPLSSPPISKLGFDPLVNMPNFDTFHSMVSRRSTQIKALLLNQSFSAGVGNWIADEILYQSQVHPQRYTSTLSKDEVKSIWKNLKSIIEISVKANNNHLQFPPDWMFHYRWSKRSSNKETPKTSKGEKISFVTSGGRTSAIVSTIQILDEESIKKLKEIEKRLSNSKKKKASKVIKKKKEDSSIEESEKKKKRKKSEITTDSEDEHTIRKKKKSKVDSSESSDKKIIKEKKKPKKKQSKVDSSESDEKIVKKIKKRSKADLSESNEKKLKEKKKPKKKQSKVVSSESSDENYTPKKRKSRGDSSESSDENYTPKKRKSRGNSSESSEEAPKIKRKNQKEKK